jgi:hypothetical protein
VACTRELPQRPTGLSGVERQRPSSWSSVPASIRGGTSALPRGASSSWPVSSRTSGHQRHEAGALRKGLWTDHPHRHPARQGVSFLSPQARVAAAWHVLIIPKMHEHVRLALGVCWNSNYWLRLHAALRIDAVASCAMRHPCCSSFLTTHNRRPSCCSLSLSLCFAMAHGPPLPGTHTRSGRQLTAHSHWPAGLRPHRGSRGAASASTRADER